ncbi:MULTISPECIES: MFS transporter [unclassified Paraflavitalea]|uniref:MFS transporter n=1 Tax=unclassified Paraflavitalea TaxID=2798305 RepID=UPI003D352A9B
MSDASELKKKLFPIINYEFTWFLFGRALFIAGMRMNPVLLGWILYEKTGSKLALGMLGLSEVIPAVLLALPAGVRVDRSNKRNLLVICLAAYFLVEILLLILTAPSISSQISPSLFSWLIYTCIFGTGIIRAYSGPAFNAFLAQLVPTENLVRAASVNSMGWLVAAVAGPALAGLLLGYTSITVSYIIGGSFVLAGLLLFSLIKPKEIVWNPGNKKTWDSVKEGLHFVWNQKALMGAMSLDMFAVLFGGATALLPVFAKDILHVGPEGLGWLISATYIGNFVAIAWLTAKPLKKHQGKLLFQVVAWFGVCIIVFAFSRSFWLSFFALFASGIFDGVSVIIRGTIFQLFVPDEMRGRVSSVNSIFINSSNELGQFESGVAASAMGTVPSVLFGGCMTIIVTIVTWYKAKGLKELNY